MESKDREFQKAIIRILILMVTGLIVWNLAVSVTNRRIAAIYYERISAIFGAISTFGAISAQYPDMGHGDWMQYLTATGNEEDGEAFLHQYGIPVKPSQWKVTEDIFVQAWQQAGSTRPDRYTILNETDLSDGRLREIYQMMEAEF